MKRISFKVFFYRKEVDILEFVKVRSTMIYLLYSFPVIGATFDILCFLELGSPIKEIFDVIKVQSSTFYLVYNSAWYWVMEIDTVGYGSDQF